MSRTLPRLLAVLTLTPTVALGAPSVTIETPTSGAFIDSWWMASGYASGVSPDHELTINGVAPTFTPILDTDLDGILDAGPWNIDMRTVPAGLGQGRSAMHLLRAEIREDVPPLGTILMSADQVAYYDLVEFDATRRTQGATNLDGVQIRITEAGLADAAQVAQRELAAVYASEILPMLPGDGPGDEFDLTLPVEFCVSLAGLGFDVDILSIDGADFGLGPSDFGLLGPADFELCFEGIHGDGWVDGDGLFTAIPDLDLDGAPDPFLALDAVPGALDARVTVGPMSAGGALYARLTVSIATASSLLGLSPSVEVLALELPCDASVAVPYATASVGLGLDGVGTPHLGVVQTAPLDLDLATPDAVLTGVCAPVEPLVDLVADAAAVLVEDGVECVMDDPICGGPRIPTTLSAALEGVEVAGSTTIDLGTNGSLAVSGDLGGLVIDHTGVTASFDTRVERDTFGKFAYLVPGQGFAYAQRPEGSFFAPGNSYDAALFVEAAQLSQVLHALYQTGSMHGELRVAGDLEDFFDHALPVDPADPLTPDLLRGFVKGLRAVIPADTELVVRIGPELAPVVVVEDGPNGYQLAVSAFQVEIEVSEAATGTVWMTAVVSAKARLRLFEDASGALRARLADTRIGFGLIGDAPVVALGDIGPGRAMAAAMTSWLTGVLEAGVATLPVPAIQVPSTSDADTQVTVSVHGTGTLPSGEEIRTKISVE